MVHIFGDMVIASGLIHCLLMLRYNKSQICNNLTDFITFFDVVASCIGFHSLCIADIGSQLSSLVSGFRTYYGNGPDSETIKWKSFEDSVKKMFDEGQKLRLRPYRRSIYRQPRCPDS
ncbi:unnamed protein product [Cochlearia groenlandica]